MPPAARSNRPGFWRSAPVKAPRSWPKSSLSTRPSGSAPQLTRMNGPAARSEWRCKAAATSSLPVPLSPTISTGGVGRGGEADRLEDLAHRGALADRARARRRPRSEESPRLVAGSRPQRLDLEGQGTLPQRPLQGQQDLVEVERLGQVVVGPAAHRLDRGGRAAEGGDDDHRQVGQRRPELGQHVQAVAAGHLEVKQHGVGASCGDPRQRLVAVGRLEGMIALGLEQQHEVAADRAVVVGHQDRGGVVRSSVVLRCCSARGGRQGEGEDGTGRPRRGWRREGRRGGPGRSRGRSPGPARSPRPWS